MRILMTADTMGGVWTYALELAKALEPSGVHIVLATMGQPLSEAQRQQVADTRSLTVRESTYRLEWMESPWEDVRKSGQWLLELEQEFRPDVVHLNGYAHGQLPFRAPVLVVGHSCVLSWWKAVKHEPAPSSWDHYRSEVTAGLHAADVVVTPSHAMLAVLQRHYGALPDSRVIHNGRDFSLYQPDARKAQVIFAAGRVWDEAKNIHLLDEAAAGLPWKVRVAGDATHPDGRREQPAHVELLGRLSEVQVAKELSAAAIYALPARYEPFGLSILEAALSGCALVLGDVPTLREIWSDAATYVNPESAEALREALVSLTQNPALRAQRAAQAYHRALGYSPVTMAAGYLAVYRQLRCAERRLAAAPFEAAPSGAVAGWREERP